MATGSSSSSSSAAGGAEESLNGLKFGKKIYFEEAKAKKGKSTGGVVRCQVEGCEVDLSDAKAYYLRHKVCSMHSKSPKVIVAGIEQRFCQQCSRFHQLPEFDQGKRSCRRRLAGHNERRRKPSPGSMMSPYYGSLSPTLFDNQNRTGGFLMDFSTYPNLAGKDSWPNTIPERGLGGPASPWQSDMQNPVPEFLRGTTNRPSFSGLGVSSEECFSGVSNSSTALSLLSNQSWGSRNSNNFLGTNGNGPTIVQPSINPGATIGQFTCPSWGFGGNPADNTSHDMPPNLNLGQFSHSSNSHYTGEPGVVQLSHGQFQDLDHSRGYDSSVQDMHWSL